MFESRFWLERTIVVNADLAVACVATLTTLSGESATALVNCIVNANHSIVGAAVKLRA
jgi:hypothetical protein